MMFEKYKKQILSAWSFVIVAATCTPMPDYGGSEEVYYDKFAHVFLFGIFAYLLFYNLKSPGIYRRLLVSFSASLLFSLIIEFLQSFIPGRDANELDLAAGVLGAFLFLAAAFSRGGKYVR